MEPTKTYPAASEEQDLFLENEFVTYTEATNTQRFFNYLVDLLFMRFALSWLTNYLLVNFLLAVSPDAAYALFSGSSLLLAGYLIAILNHLVYYTLCEKAFRGHTLGKLLTGTRVIREDGEELTFKDALLRSLCRMVPFDALSIWFGNGIWHDAWTKTKVIQTR